MDQLALSLTSSESPVMWRLGACWLALSLLVPPAAAEAPPAWPLATAARQRLDRSALAQELESLTEDRITIAGAVPAWVLTGLQLPAEEELRRSCAAHTALVLREPARLGPAPALRLLARLVEQLPAHQRPAGFRYSLTLLDRPVPASTPGGGLVVLPTALVDLLLRDRVRGEAALAFVLARELAHMALGHCRRGWQCVVLEEELERGLHRLEPSTWRDLLQTRVQVTGQALQFLFSRHQEYQADLFALHLCRNAGLSLDHALDGLRLVAALSSGDSPRHPALRYYLASTTDPLRRLKRLLLERDGVIEPGDEFGLFVYDPSAGGLIRCRPGSVTAEERPIVFIHGMYGTRTTFEAYLRRFSREESLAGRPLLVFRHPGNASLARSGQFLLRQVRAVIADPTRAVFVCHSAGGLVFRCYAEKFAGGFDRAVILATPHAGSDLTSLKFLVDVLEFAGTLRFGLTEGITRTLTEGRGEIGLDLHPDSLFLRWLGRDRKLARRYHIFYGEWLRPTQAAALQAAFHLTRRQLEPRLAGLAPEGELRRLGKRLMAGLTLPPEILRGDVVVSSASARLPGAATTTKLRLRHLAFRNDPEAIERVLDAVLER